MWFQKSIHLGAQKRGFHLITDEIEQQLPQIQGISVGLLHLFIQHTSASLTLNENADPTVRLDMEQHFNKFVPENAPTINILMKVAMICLRISNHLSWVRAWQSRLQTADLRSGLGKASI